MHEHKQGNISHNKTSQRIGFVSLGCVKALVDSERILTQLRAEGYAFADDYHQADLVIVNTCGFLDSAREESLAAIADALEQNGRVIVTGCLGARPEQIQARYPKDLAITGPQQYETVIAAVHQALPPQYQPYTHLVPGQGVRLTPRHYAYLKIAEGCNNRCSFCIIPQLRGRLVSRPVDQVLQEAENLVRSGVKELMVISQDTGAYGVDVKYQQAWWQHKKIATRFLDLCTELSQLNIWIRLHYIYPYPHIDRVIPLMAEGKILPYLDIPFQHASPPVLKAMRRPAAEQQTLARIQQWRKDCPQLTIRSTFIVGFPGETEEDFQYLLNWLETAKLDRVGCFRYENVAEARSATLKGQIDAATKDRRWHQLMQLQQQISEDIQRKKIGKRLKVIVDAVDQVPSDSETNHSGTHQSTAIARSAADAPDIDGLVYVQEARHIRPGDLIEVDIVDAQQYDLIATPVNHHIIGTDHAP